MTGGMGMGDLTVYGFGDPLGLLLSEAASVARV